MAEASQIKDDFPWLAGAGVTLDPVLKTAVVTGAATLLSKKFVVGRMVEISLFLQGTGTGAGGAWKILAANGYDSTRPAQSPGVFADVTAAFGAAAAVTPPGGKNFAAAFAGAVNDFFSSWACPFDAIQFSYTQARGTETIQGQFSASEI